MNFFETQDRARRGARYGMLLMAAIVLSPAVFWTYSVPSLGKVYWYDPLFFCLVIIFVMAAACWYQSHRFCDSSDSISMDFGGHLISLQPEEGDRWVLDIVEEMAIASGSQVPMVYVLLDQEGINAFSPGFTPQDSAIAVTYGATVLLNREEMQALVAHLFCQIHNNDMRMDIRMVGLDTGALVLAFLMALSTAGSFLLFGFGWCALVLFATSRIARQRKYLADATAAQLTRNPQSVASVLKKIEGYEYGSLLRGEETSLFLSTFFAAPFETFRDHFASPHPSLEKRIKRLDPGWDGEYPYVPSLASLVGSDEATAENRRRWQELGAISTAVRRKGEETTAAHLYQTQVSLSKIPAEVRAAARHTSGAQALIYRLLLCANEDARAQQLNFLQGVPDPEVVQFLQGLSDPMNGLDGYLRLPLFDLCIPALKHLETDSFQQFTHNISLLIRTDYRTYLMGLALLHILNTQVLGAPKTKGRYLLRQLERDVTLLLKVLAIIGHRGGAQAQLAYSRACEVLPFHVPPTNRVDGSEELDAVEIALKRLPELKQQDKDILMDAIAVCIEHDGRITHEEIELMRAIANILDCPMPARFQTPSLKDTCATPLPP